MIAVPRHRFYQAAALAMAALVLAGFARTYYLRVFLEVPPITRLLHLHAALFTAWVALFVTQTQLIARHRVTTHMKLGVLGAFLALAVVIVGVLSTIESIQDSRPRPMGFTNVQFAIFPLYSVGLFGAFVAAGIGLRRTPTLHKRFMVLAMIAAMGPPAARLIRFFGAGEHFLLLQTSVTAVLVFWCFWADFRRHGRVHPLYWVGGGLLVAAWPLRYVIGRSEAWTRLFTAWTS
jgi:hypothetical protein